MGFSLTWVAVKGKTREEILSILGWEPTGERMEIHDADATLVDLGTGWQVAQFAMSEVDGLSPEQTMRLSDRGELVTVRIEEHAMASDAERVVWGKEQWTVSCFDDDVRVKVGSGLTLPPEYEAVKAELEQKQRDEGVNYLFDLPAEFAALATGFRHDRDIDSANTFEVLRRKAAPNRQPAPPPPSFFQTPARKQRPIIGMIDKDGKLVDVPKGFLEEEPAPRTGPTPLQWILYGIAGVLIVMKLLKVF